MTEQEINQEARNIIESCWFDLAALTEKKETSEKVIRLADGVYNTMFVFIESLDGEE